MLTFSDIKKYFPEDLLVALSDDMDMEIPNEELINKLVEDGYSTVNAAIAITDEEVKKKAVAEYVMADLYERRGMIERSEFHFKKMVSIIKMPEIKRESGGLSAPAVSSLPLPDHNYGEW